MCIKLNQKTVTRIPAQQIVFTHTNYFKMSQHEQQLHHNKCKEFAAMFDDGTFHALSSIFDDVYSCPHLRDAIAQYAQDTFDNDNIVAIIASDVDYFVMLQQLA